MQNAADTIKHEPRNLHADLGIGNAVAALKNGRKVRRAGWNGKGMYLAVIEPIEFDPTSQHVITTGHVVDYDGHPIREESRITMTEPFVFLHTAQGGTIPWNCSQADLLATDWEVVP